MIAALERRRPAMAQKKTSSASRKPHPALAAVQASPSPRVKVAVSDIDGILRGKLLHKD
jgi:glutamine synthetase